MGCSLVPADEIVGVWISCSDEIVGVWISSHGEPDVVAGGDAPTAVSGVGVAAGALAPEVAAELLAFAGSVIAPWETMTPVPDALPLFPVLATTPGWSPILLLRSYRTRRMAYLTRPLSIGSGHDHGEGADSIGPTSSPDIPGWRRPSCGNAIPRRPASPTSRCGHRQPS
jgi:hypothetical protein